MNFRNVKSNYLCIISVVLLRLPVSLADEQSFRQIQRQCPAPLLQAEFCGVHGVAIVDTGFSDGIVFDSESIDLDRDGFEKSKTRLNAMFGKRDASAWLRVPFVLDSVELPGISAIRYDLNELYGNSRQHEFIAGMECLRGRTLAFNANISNVRLDVSNKSPSKGVVLPFRWNRFNCPMVEVKLPTLGGVHLLLDTGSNGTISLTRERLEALVRMGNAVAIDQHDKVVDAVGILRNHKGFVLRRLSLGDTTFINLPVNIDETELIGTGLLRYFDATLDFSRNCLTVSLPAEQLTPIQVAPRASGMFSKALGVDRIQILEIEADSPAEEAGLKVDDIIHEISGKPVAEYSHSDRVQLFSQSGTTLQLAIERDGEHREVALKLRYDFPYPPEWPPEPPEFNPE